jgi:hypothetical protein
MEVHAEHHTSEYEKELVFRLPDSNFDCLFMILHSLEIISSPKMLYTLKLCSQYHILY